MRALINGLNLSYTSTENDGGLPVIFIHGFPFSKLAWRNQLKSIPEKVYAIAYDVRGHGESEVGDDPYSVEFFVDDLFGLMDYLSIPKAVICGISMGGYIALRAVEREPGRISGLILCDTKSEADPDHSKILRAASIKYIQQNGMTAYGEEFVKSLFTHSSIDQKTMAVKEALKMISTNPAPGACKTLMALAARTDTTAVLEKISCPTLLLVGKEDKIASPEVMKTMQDKISGSKLEVIPDASHLSNMENQGVFNSHLISFLLSL